MLKDMLWHSRDNLGNVPRVHGNGFIQFDLSDTVRLHVWGHPAIPRQKTDTPIHNHRFAFHSIILKGMLTDVRYQPYRDEDDWTHFPYEARARQGEDTVLVPCNTTCGVRMVASKNTYTPGQSYHMKEGEIHESIPHGLTVTIISKTGPSLAQGGPIPLVYVPVGIKPDNAFNRYSFPAEDLWTIIHEAIR